VHHFRDRGKLGISQFLAAGPENRVSFETAIAGHTHQPRRRRRERCRGFRADTITDGICAGVIRLTTGQPAAAGLEDGGPDRRQLALGFSARKVAKTTAAKHHAHFRAFLQKVAATKLSAF
jgi:hypothetical protein